ncbi:hypothetical protein DPMN_132595 [Dreissena polymorpha]|uniref:Uncharacterized protein n=1 Tax=Dreissena polymorpha TaxID=45954 RepID=A0A9D4FWF7_DREPO|nr:hypothetical protein DPMN_132595 [Dreissena polymorpha]
MKSMIMVNCMTKTSEDITMNSEKLDGVTSFKYMYMGATCSRMVTILRRSR